MHVHHHHHHPESWPNIGVDSMEHRVESRGDRLLTSKQTNNLSLTTSSRLKGWGAVSERARGGCYFENVFSEQVNGRRKASKLVTFKIIEQACSIGRCGRRILPILATASAVTVLSFRVYFGASFLSNSNSKSLFSASGSESDPRRRRR